MTLLKLKGIPQFYKAFLLFLIMINDILNLVKGPTNLMCPKWPLDQSFPIPDF